METALECYLMAAKCDEDAKATVSAGRRQLLQQASASWRTLGDQRIEKEKVFKRTLCHDRPHPSPQRQRG
jgi:hypothetical protein